MKRLDNAVKDLTIISTPQRLSDYAGKKTAKIAIGKEEIEQDGKNSEMRSSVSGSSIQGMMVGKENIHENRLSKVADIPCIDFLSQIKKSKENLRKVFENEKDYSSFDNRKEYLPLEWSKEEDDDFRRKHSFVPRELSALVAPLPRNGAKLPKVSLQPR